jgi:hypothetical protein
VLADLRILWPVPITAAERAFKAAHGLEGLEVLFETRRVEYWQAQRDSLVPGDR